MQVEESLFLVATTATLVPRAGKSNKDDVLPKADVNALVIPLELYLLSLAKDIQISRRL